MVAPTLDKADLEHLLSLLFQYRGLYHSGYLMFEW